MASTFVEFRDPQPSFVRPIDATGSWIYNSADVTSPTRSHGPRSSRASNQSRATYSQSALAPPPRPLDIPTPAPAARGAAEPSDNAQDYHYSNAGVQEADADEYVGIDIADIEIDNSGRTATTKRKKGFVGGFVSNLRRLPRAVARNLVHERQPQSTIEHFPYPSEHGAMPYDQPTGAEEAVPPYSSPTSPQVHYDSDAASTPQPHQTPLQPARPAKWPQGPTYGEPYYSHRSTKSSSTKSSTPSGDPSRTSFPPTIRNPDPDSSSSESSLTETNHPMASVRPIRAPLVPQDDDPQPAASSIGHSTPTQARPLPQPQPPPPTRPLAVHIDSGSPTYHEPPRAADYGRMESPIRPPEEPPLSTQLARLGRFFQTLNELPWFASTIATDFIPAESGRARRKHASNASWYTSKHRDVDLLAGGSSSRVLLGAGEHQVPHASSGTLPMYAQASRASVDNLRNQPRMAPTYPAQYPYPITPLPPPPPLYFYPSPAAQAEGATVEIRPQPAYPLYLVGVPSTASYISSPEPGHHSPPPPIHIHSPQYGVGPAPG